ncbi:PAS domain S-box [Terriglobus roseus DSM 18391]|uniref:histidine kinase n=1 Tax=Terriglobus roseus (strain DSM 18391 / NRRL B-41598 / KBS 63) TaxID=926566 RepID=I3ZIE1_TERRK|nr:ATP-binding protein [Terriglobus roseus]AFL89009.1 PAS domain S-box [Terriglobus roseus DSM 18391]
MRLRAPRSIMGQLIGGTVIVQLLVFSIFLFFSVRQQFRDGKTHDRNRLQSQTGIIAGLLVEPLTDNDTDLLDHVVRAVNLTSTIRAARITDAQGKTLRISGADMPSELTPRERALLPLLNRDAHYVRMRQDDGDDEGVQPVVTAGVVRGIVWMTQDNGVVTQTPVTVLQSLLIYAACALFGNLFLVYLLAPTMTRPLRQLSLATLQVQNDPNDLSAFPLKVVARNEAGALTASFNAMVNEIARQRRGTQETLNLLDAMLTGAPIGFAFYDRQLRYVRINDRLAKMHGMSAEQHLGKRLRDLIPRGGSTRLADQVELLVESVFRTGEPVAEHLLTGVMPGDESSRSWLVSYFPVMVNDEIRWVGVIASEVTQRVQAEESMRRSEKQAAAGRLAASIAHEINNPLEAVSNLLYLIRTSGASSALVMEYAAMAQQELSRVGEITQQTLRFYRQSNQPSDVSVVDVLRSVLVLHNARMQSPKIEIHQRFADNIMLFGFAGELRQLFANLVGNAIDAMPNGGSLYLRARPAWVDGRRGVRITVADTGVGMSDTVRERIFEPFFTTKENTGTGLGLWASEEILDRHHAAVLVRSRRARFENDRSSGTVFSIYLPWDGVPRGPRIVHSAAHALADHLV